MKKFTGFLLLLLAISFMYAKALRVKDYVSTITVFENNKTVINEQFHYEFQKGHFDHINRNLSDKKNDGIIIHSAYMDSVPFPVGLGTGQIQVDEKSIQWNFPKKAKSNHTFSLNYQISGLIFQKDQYDIFQIYLLPPKYEYKIDTVKIDIQLNEYAGHLQGELIDNPKLSLNRAGTIIQIRSKKPLLKNENALLTMHFPKGSIISEQPAYIKMMEKANLFFKIYLIFSLVLIGFSIYGAIRICRKYSHAFKADKKDLTTISLPPENLTAWETGFLLCKNFSEYHYMHFTASLFFHMIEKGYFIIKHKDFKKKYFEIEKKTIESPHDPYDQLIYQVIFPETKNMEAIELGKALSHANLKLKDLLNRISQKLTDYGLLDSRHYKKKKQYSWWGISLGLFGVLTLIPFIKFIAVFTISSVVLSLGIIFSGLILFFGAQSIQPLTLEGYRLTQLSYYYKKHLEHLLKKKTGWQNEINPEWLFALNLQTIWFEKLKTGEFQIPEWFCENDDDTDNSKQVFINFLTMVLTYSDAPLTGMKLKTEKEDEK